MPACARVRGRERASTSLTSTIVGSRARNRETIRQTESGTRGGGWEAGDREGAPGAVRAGAVARSQPRRSGGRVRSWARHPARIGVKGQRVCLVLLRRTVPHPLCVFVVAVIPRDPACFCPEVRPRSSGWDEAGRRLCNGTQRGQLMLRPYGTAHLWGERSGGQTACNVPVSLRAPSVHPPALSDRPPSSLESMVAAACWTGKWPTAASMLLSGGAGC